MSNVCHEPVLFGIQLINILKYMTTKFVECCRRIFNVSTQLWYLKLLVDTQNMQ